LTILLEVEMTDEDAEGILNERIKELEEEIKKALMELEEKELEPWRKRELRHKFKDLNAERNMLNNALMMDSASKQRIAGKVLTSKANTIAAETRSSRTARSTKAPVASAEPTPRSAAAFPTATRQVFPASLAFSSKPRCERSGSTCLELLRQATT
jgi:hypothetical protein